MSKPAIEVSGLGKRYVIEHESRHDTLRDTLHHAARKLWRRARWGTGFEREDFWALRDVSFSVQPGEVVGVIGRNGAGKSTLLKILSRITEPTTGSIRLRGRVASLLEVGTGFHPDLTGRENIFLNGAILGMSRAEIRKKFDEIVAFAEVERFLDTPVKRYSSGMYVRLAFAVAAHLEPEILIVDEVLAVGDAAFQKKCLGKMQDVARGQGRTVLFVSHNLGTILELCQKSLFLERGRLTSFGPSPEIARLYRGSAQLHEVSFAHGPLRSLKASADAHGLAITARWHTEAPIDLPALGFVVFDEFGRPVLGSNPRHNRGGPFTPAASGILEALVSSPRLRHGRYSLSVWFGDSGGRDLVHHADCLAFDVDDPALTDSLPASVHGNVLPDCKWRYLPAHED